MSGPNRFLQNRIRELKRELEGRFIDCDDDFNKLENRIIELESRIRELEDSLDARISQGVGRELF
jgi:tetrahydromethanopterin S-methyltransferase subunit G